MLGLIHNLILVQLMPLRLLTTKPLEHTIMTSSSEEPIMVIIQLTEVNSMLSLQLIKNNTLHSKTSKAVGLMPQEDKMSLPGKNSLRRLTEIWTMKRSLTTIKDKTELKLKESYSRIVMPITMMLLTSSSTYKEELLPCNRHKLSSSLLQAAMLT
jgi:hypothetical protein